MLKNLVANNEIENLTDNEKLVFLYEKLEKDIENEKEEKQFLKDLKNDKQFYKDMKGYCGRLLEYMRQRYESLQNLYNTIKD